jgi:hypothetical protein
MFFAVGTFPVGQNCVVIFPIAQQEISRQPFFVSGYFLLCNFVVIFPFSTMSGYFLLGVSGQVRSPVIFSHMSAIFSHMSDSAKLVKFPYVRHSFPYVRHIFPYVRHSFPCVRDTFNHMSAIYFLIMTLYLIFQLHFKTKCLRRMMHTICYTNVYRVHRVAIPVLMIPHAYHHIIGHLGN